MDSELERKINQILVENLANDENFAAVVNDLLELVQLGCSEKAAHHNDPTAEQFYYWSNYQSEIMQLRAKMKVEKFRLP